MPPRFPTSCRFSATRSASWRPLPARPMACWHNGGANSEDETSDGTGLRLPQVGALRAVCAHFAVGSAGVLRRMRAAIP